MREIHIDSTGAQTAERHIELIAETLLVYIDLPPADQDKKNPLHIPEDIRKSAMPLPPFLFTSEEDKDNQPRHKGNIYQKVVLIVSGGWANLRLPAIDKVNPAQEFHIFTPNGCALVTNSEREEILSKDFATGSGYSLRLSGGSGIILRVVNKAGEPNSRWAYVGDKRSS